MAVFTIYQAMTQKQEKDTEFKVAADKGTNNWILQTQAWNPLVWKMQGRGWDTGSFHLSELPHPPQ